MMKIRIAKPGDAELLADLSRKTFYDTFSETNSKANMDKFMNEVFTKEALIKEVGADNNIFLLAEDEEKVLGYARIREHNIPPGLNTTNAIEIARLYAIKESIGKGVGKMLMQACINIAALKKADTLWLGVWEKNERAIHFYKQWGFEKFADHIFQLGDDLQTDWLMKKKL